MFVKIKAPVTLVLCTKTGLCTDILSDFYLPLTVHVLWYLHQQVC